MLYLRRGHANLVCIVTNLTDDPQRESDLGDVFYSYLSCYVCSALFAIFAVVTCVCVACISCLSSVASLLSSLRDLGDVCRQRPVDGASQEVKVLVVVAEDDVRNPRLRVVDLLMYLCLFSYQHMYMYVSIYIYIYIHTHTYIYIYI